MAAKPQESKAQKIEQEVDEVKGIMTNNIDLMLRNHEKVEDLERSTDVMAQSAQTFKKQAHEVKSVMWWKNVKLLLLIALIIGIVLAVIIIIIVIAVEAKK